MILCRLAKCCDASIFALAAKFNLEPHDVVRSSITCIKDSFWFYFLKISLVTVVSFCIIYCVCFIFIVHAAFVRIKLTMMMIYNRRMALGVSRYRRP